jgi:hypothetical protein
VPFESNLQALRHAVGGGKPVQLSEKQLGYGSIKMMVDVYGHLVPGANRAAVNTLSGLQPPTPTGKLSLPTERAPNPHLN